jgi:hypothetical protein
MDTITRDMTAQQMWGIIEYATQDQDKLFYTQRKLDRLEDELDQKMYDLNSRIMNLQRTEIEVRRLENNFLALENNDEKAGDNEVSCKICFENKVCIAPNCGHLSMCVACARHIHSKGERNCPICRKPWKALTKIIIS